jgi:hypothetical protein
MFNKIKSLLYSIRSYEERFNKIELALGRIELRQCNNINSKDILDYEFKVSSQWGEDGIIQYLIQKVNIENKIFVEFGVEKYTESNTRFLLQNNNWKGLIIDGSEENINYIKNDPIYWRHNLKAECAFINKDNINELISKNGISGDIGILSVDIDGNDYWVWEAIDCISPRIVICEYNSHFGSKNKVSVPYDEDFVRNQKHFSNIYYGASISALEYLGTKKKYSLITSNSAGNNIFFVRNDLIKDIKKTSGDEAYQIAQFRESRNKEGTLTFNSIEENLNMLKDMELIDVEKMQTIKIEQLIK